jgi:hypothetical protein
MLLLISKLGVKNPGLLSIMATRFSTLTLDILGVIIAVLSVCAEGNHFICTEGKSPDTSHCRTAGACCRTGLLSFSDVQNLGVVPRLRGNLWTPRLGCVYFIIRCRYLQQRFPNCGPRVLPLWSS